MRDDIRPQRLFEHVMGPPDDERDRILERAFEADPSLRAEYERLREAWDAMASLPGREPPPGARERARSAVLAAASETGPRGVRRALLKAAAAVALFVGGMATGTLVAGGAPVAEPLPSPVTPAVDGGEGLHRYVLLIRADTSPEGEVDVASAMSGWAARLWADDRLVWAERLFADAATYVGPDDPDPGSAPGRIFLIRARDRSEAAEVARRAPHLAWGGTVEVLPTTAAGR